MDYPYLNSNATHYLSLPTPVYGGTTEGVADDDPFTFIAKTSAYYQVDIFLRCYVANYSPSAKIRARLFSEILNSSNAVQETELLDEWIAVDDTDENWNTDLLSTDESGTSGSFSDMETLHGSTVIKLQAGYKFKPYIILQGLAGAGNYVAYKGYAAIACVGAL